MELSWHYHHAPVASTILPLISQMFQTLRWLLLFVILQSLLPRLSFSLPTLIIGIITISNTIIIHHNWCYYHNFAMSIHITFGHQLRVQFSIQRNIIMYYLTCPCCAVRHISLNATWALIRLTSLATQSFLHISSFEIHSHQLRYTVMFICVDNTTLSHTKRQRSPMGFHVMNSSCAR